jgi:microcystin-dependent protein
MTIDFQTKPALSDLYTDVFTTIRALTLALAKMDYTGMTNIPTGAIRYNTSTDIFETYDGAAWVSTDFNTAVSAHIANSSIHEARHVGSMEFIAYSTPDSGWLLCNGQAVSRTTYATLFAKIGIAYGVGDGSTTFNVPNLIGRIPIGVDTGVSALNALGKTAGSWDHTHTTPNHQHTIASHTHTMANHTHTVGAHSHTIASHTHTVGAHYHDVTAYGGTINITSSGSHNHNAFGKEGGSNGSGADRPQGASSGSGSNVTWTNGVPTGNSAHTHPASNFAGTVGQVSGSNGDVGFNTGGSGTLTSDNSTSFASGAPSTNTTDGSGTLTSNTGEGGSTTGTANPPVVTGYWQIKY